MATVDPAILDRIDNEYAPRTPHDVPDRPLFHYTDVRAFKSIVEGGTVWATDARYLNDRQECVYGEMVMKGTMTDLLAATTVRVRQTFLSRLIDIYEGASISKRVPVFVASFCANGDLLSQWRAYAAGGGGYAIGFAEMPLPKPGAPVDNTDMGLWLIKCEYKADVVKAAAAKALVDLMDALEKEIRTHATDNESAGQIAHLFHLNALRHLATHSLRLKHHAFEEEKEWRLIAMHHKEEIVRFRESRNGLVPYVEVDLRMPDTKLLALGGVVVGPTQHPEHGVTAAAWFLNNRKYDGNKLVTLSIAPYRGL